MTTRVYYFTGTGNSLWAARFLARHLGAEAPVSMVRALQAGDVKPVEDRLVLVFPVYMYRVPHLVVDFLRRLDTDAPVVVVATAGGDPGDLFVRVERLFAERGLILAAGYAVAVQSNYVPFGGAPVPEVLRGRLEDAAHRLGAIATRIQQGDHAVERAHSRFRAWVHPGILYRLGYKYASVADKSYRVDDTCDGCGVCARVCPVGNVEVVEGRPTWRNRCLQCMACLQWCPKEAIQVKDKTRGERRYHHPEVTLKDMVAQKGSRDAAHQWRKQAT